MGASINLTMKENVYSDKFKYHFIQKIIFGICKTPLKNIFIR